MPQAARVALVTDSTSYLPPELAASLGIEVVPLQVVVGGTSYDEVSASADGSVAAALHGRRPMTTSRPAPSAFVEAYTRAARSGCEAVVSVHLSSQMSGTVESARLGAKEAPVPVEVVDSLSLGMGFGYAVLAAAEVAAAGGSVHDVAVVAQRRAAATSVMFYLDTLDQLRRGGRIGPAAALLGSALAVKPLLQLVDGHIEPLEKVRTAARAIARLEEVAVGRAGGRAVDLAVHHLASHERADALAGRLRERVPGLVDLHVSEVGAVVGAHVGPGMLSVVVAPR